jgi:hypothetical protein
LEEEAVLRTRTNYNTNQSRVDMESKRFGGGLVGGLLLGVTVILLGTVAAGSSIGLFGAFSPASASVGQAKGTSDVATYTLTYTTTTSHGLYQAGNGSAPSPGSTNTTTIVTTVTTTFPAYYALSNSPSSVQAQASPSRLNNLAAQPLLAGGIVMVPVLIALVVGAIGAVLYRASLGQKKEAPAGTEVD